MKPILVDIWYDLCYFNRHGKYVFDRLDFGCKDSNGLNAWHIAEQIYAEIWY